MITFFKSRSHSIKYSRKQLDIFERISTKHQMNSQPTNFFGNL
jgi:hypothetical protein